MNPQETQAFTEFVRKVRDERNLTVLLIEHDMKVVLGVSERVTVLDHGEKIAEGGADRGDRERAGARGLSRARGRPDERRAAAARRAATPLLELKNVHAYYGAIHALKGVSLAVGDGEIVTLLGANGAGKSTTLKTISGLLRPRKGSIQFAGDDLTRRSATQIVKAGVAQSPEGRRLFGRMTVLENLEMGAFQRTDKDGIAADLDRVFDLFPRLAERRSQKAGTLSGGEQQMCAMGRALLARPRLLLLDEPSMGLAPVLVERIFEVIVEINKQGTTVLLVEQNALMALEIAHRGYVLGTGKVALADTAEALRGNEAVRKTYLGED